jgi:hypothetical protein
MAQKNRELSQFGSFLEIDNTNKNIGIATTATPFVGIGTTNPTVKFTVIGDTNISGNTTITGDVNVGGAVSASSYSLNGLPLVDASVQSWDTSGFDVYRTQGNVGIGTSTYTEKLTVAGNVSAGQFISTVTTGTSPLSINSQTLVTNLNADYLRGKTPPSGNIVGTTDTQTLSNKTLTSPVISTIINGGTLTLPTTTGTLVSTGSTGVVTSNMIADLSITNSDVAAAASISYSKLNLANSITNSDISSTASIAVSKLASSTISGISLGSNLNNLTAGTFINYSSGSTYNGSSAITVSVAATTANTSNTVVARDNSGDFSAGTISCANVTASFTVQAADFNSTSDENLKTNIETVQSPLDTLQQLRGVTFDWKETNKASIGVIAQELEQVLPELVNNGDHKSVNYNGLIGVLIEAVKELSEEVKELKSKVL